MGVDFLIDPEFWVSESVYHFTFKRQKPRLYYFMSTFRSFWAYHYNSKFTKYIVKPSVQLGLIKITLMLAKKILKLNINVCASGEVFAYTKLLF